MIASQKLRTKPDLSVDKLRFSTAQHDLKNRCRSDLEES